MGFQRAWRRSTWARAEPELAVVTSSWGMWWPRPSVPAWMARVWARWVSSGARRSAGVALRVPIRWRTVMPRMWCSWRRRVTWVGGVRSKRASAAMLSLRQVLRWRRSSMAMVTG